MYYWLYRFPAPIIPLIMFSSEFTLYLQVLPNRVLQFNTLFYAFDCYQKGLFLFTKWAFFFFNCLLMYPNNFISLAVLFIGHFHNLTKAFFQRSPLVGLLSSSFKFSWYKPEFIPYSATYMQYFFSLKQKLPIHSSLCLRKIFKIIVKIFLTFLPLFLSKSIFNLWI